MNQFLVVLGSILLSQSLLAASPSGMTNLDQYKKSLGFNSYYQKESQLGRRLRVAVLDKGFYGYEKAIGRSLPRDTKYIAGPVESPEGLSVVHGLKMAQILVSMMSDDMNAEEFIPQLYLYNSFGFTNFSAAIDDAIKRKVDVILYSEVWEYGGNNDGGGFINAAVDKASRAGILWVNAAGNFALTTYNTKIQTGQDGWVLLPDQNNGVAIRCKPTESSCSVKIVLAWNDFKDDVEAGTKKDLDLVLTDDFLNIVQTSALKQSDDPKESRPGHSKYPREIISAELKSGLYFLRVKNRSENFGKRDSLRITVDGDGITMPSHTSDETVLNPADNESVITVGASDSDRSSSSEIMDKPDVLAPSSIKLTTGEEFRGSSNSAAIVAGGVGLLLSMDPGLNRSEVLKQITGGAGNGGGDWTQTGLSLNQLQFGPTGPGCFVDVRVTPTPVFLIPVLNRGGIFVDTTAQVRIMVPFDPITLDANLERRYENDMIVVLPSGQAAVYPRNSRVPPGSVEVFQRPREAGPCRVPDSSGGGSNGGKNFRLPR